MAYLVDRNRSTYHEFLGTGQDDTIVIKTTKLTVAFGLGGDDVIQTGINNVREQIYGGVSLQSPDGNYFGHLMPDLNQRQLRQLWINDGDDEAHGGNRDWMKLGGGADTGVWHGGNYTEPGIQFGFNPAEGDVIVFEHDLGFEVSRIQATREGNYWNLLSVDLRGHSSNPITDGQWVRLDFRSDGRGEHLRTGGEDYQHLVGTRTENLVRDVTNHLRAFSAEYDVGSGEDFLL